MVCTALAVAATVAPASAGQKKRPTTTTTVKPTTTTVKPTTTTVKPTTTTVKPTTTTTVKPTTTTTVPPPPGTRFSTLPVGSALPSDAACAAAVRRTSSEPRPDNNTANNSVPPPGSFSLTPLTPYYGYDSRTTDLEARVTGNFTGKTDEIIQWASCKWGFDEDLVRAIAVNESNWHMSQLGDTTSDQSKCPPGMTAPCPRSFGIHQVTWSSDPMGTYSWSAKSTAFNLDASLLVHRICYEGYMVWLRNIGYTNYAAGDLWGCVGQWYSGNWHDSGAELYNSHVQTHLNNKAWLSASF